MRTSTVRSSTPVAVSALVAAIMLCVPLCAHAQRETSIWYFGNRAGLDFNIPPATLTTPSEVTTSVMNASEGSAVECDRSTGALLFYTNGIQVFDRTNTPMPNSAGANALGGGVSSTQAVLSVPDPGNANRYYLFTTTDNNAIGAAEFNIVDMTQRGGLGDVTVRRQQLPTLAGTAPPSRVCEKVAATRDAAGTGYWVMFHDFPAGSGTSNTFYAYHLSGAGIDQVQVSNAGTPLTSSNPLVRGELKFSPDGQWAATANENLTADLFRFNNATGAVTFVVRLFQTQTYGLSFSPNSRLLYVNDGWNTTNPGSITQFNLANPAPGAISASAVVVGQSTAGQFGGMQIAPDGRIYAARFNSTSLGAINCPNVPGTGCGYIENAFTFTGGRTSTWGIPNIVLESVATPEYAGPDTAICAGSSVKIGLPARAGYTYSWTGAGLDLPNVATPTASPTATTNYRVIATSPFGCTDTDNVTVTVNPLPTVTVSPDIAICAGSSTPLTASGGTTFRWSPAGGLSDPNIANPVASPTTTTDYTVTVTDGNKCVNTATMRVTVNPKPSVTAGADVAICNGTSTQLSATGAAGLTFKWEPNTALSNENIPNPIASPTATTTYMVIATNSDGCRDTARTTVTVNPVPVAAVAQSSVVICEGDQGALSASGGTGFRWEPVTGLDNPNIATPKASPAATTLYSVIVTNASGCADTAQVTVTVNPKPVVTLLATDTVCAGRGKMIVASGGTIYRWRPTLGLSDSTIPNPIASPLVTTVYTVVVENSFGCRDSADISVVVRAPSATIALPDTVADPHQRGFHLPIRLSQTSQLSACVPDSLTVELEFDASLFLPTGVTVGQITRNQLSGGRRIVAITFPSTAPFGSSGVLGDLIGDILLGDSASTPLHIRSVRWSGLVVTSDSTDGQLRLLPICLVGGARLLDFGNGFGITKMVPNPGSGTVAVEVATVEQGSTLLEVYSTSGARVFSTRWESVGAVSGIGDIREIRLPADLPSGVYRVVLRTPARQDAKSLVITK